MKYERQDTGSPVESVGQIVEEKSRKKISVRHLFYKVSYCVYSC